MDLEQKFYSDEFKEDTVRLVLATGKSCRQIADELGVSDRTISNWVRKHKAKDSSTDATITTTERQELIKLRKDCKRTEMERDILKKALGIVSKVLP